MTDYVDIPAARVEDRRETHGEVVKIPIKENVSAMRALTAVANELSTFMQKKLGRGYETAAEVGQPNEIIVREPGHQYYGLKVFVEGGCVFISRVAVLEDETILRQFVDYLQLLLTQEESSDC